MLGTTHPMIQHHIPEDLPVTVARFTFVYLDRYEIFIQILKTQVSAEIYSRSCVIQDSVIGIVNYTG